MHIHYINHILFLYNGNINEMKGVLAMPQTEIYLGESLVSFIEMHRKGMSLREIDEIELEIERMEDMDDKSYIVSRINDGITICTKFIKRIKDNDTRFMSKKGITTDDLKEYESFLKTLKSLSEKIKKKRPKGKEYGLIHEV